MQAHFYRTGLCSLLSFVQNCQSNFYNDTSEIGFFFKISVKNVVENNISIEMRKKKKRVISKVLLGLGLPIYSEVFFFRIKNTLSNLSFQRN